MSYTALYRKFRPLKFSEMVGQEHITKTLKNQIIENRVGHAYLFSGGRGTGKTSSAKIMARVINCLNPKNGEPCNECSICRAILSGSLTDVVEMDAASNNSVEDIRSIRDEVNFLPTTAKYRIYIIDEVHMLSTGAFNALLKTLEEPPEHVKFILATTEPQKLPATILSRCQRFDFKRISVEDVMKRLKIICEESKIEITEDALRMIAILAEGALRDGISILERCLQEETKNINEELVRDLVGIPKLTYIREVAKNIIEKNPDGAIQVTNKVIDEGKDLDNFLWEIIKYIKNILIYKSTSKLELYNENEIKFIADYSKKIENEKLLDIIYNLSELAGNMKWSTQKVIIFQTGIIKECMESNEFINNVGTVHTGNSNVGVAPQGHPKEKIHQQNNVGVAPLGKTQQLKQQNIVNIAPLGDSKQKNRLSYWQNVLDKIKQTGKVMIYTNLIGTNAIQINDMTVGIEFPGKITEFAKKILEEHENKALIEKLVSMEAGDTMKIKYIQLEEGVREPNKIENISNGIEGLEIPINIIDE